MFDRLQRNVTLAPYTTFHIGGPADYFLIAKTKEDLIDAVSWSREQQMPFFILGQGANILVGDKGFRGLVIKNEAKNIMSLRGVSERTTKQSRKGQVETETDGIASPGSVRHLASLEDGLVFDPDAQARRARNDEEILLTAESGATIADLIAYTAELGLSGLEHFAGIPSSLGGALWQNLHFLGPDRKTTVFIGDIVEQAKILSVLSDELRVTDVDASYFHFGYDYSILHDNHDVVLSTTLRLKKSTKEVIMNIVTENIAWRNAKHPAQAAKKSAGSVFKKIEGHGAGRLIEKVGLKGKRIGGAQVSPDHANFIVNTGEATAQDVRLLISLIQNEVKKRIGLHLDTEISFIGEF